MDPRMSVTLLRLLTFSCIVLLVLQQATNAGPRTHLRSSELLTRAWHFRLGDIPNGHEPALDDSRWRILNLPHDWSIEGTFSKDNPATPGGGALPGGIGWYRKTFNLPESDKEKLAFIEFDGIYRNSEVWINGHSLGRRPYGYSSFRYELTPFLKQGDEKNVLAVRVDNSQQPNSRWYSGSGIYRNVRLVKTGRIAVEHWGTFVTTPEVSEKSAKVSIVTKVRNATHQDQSVTLKIIVLNEAGKNVGEATARTLAAKQSVSEVHQEVIVRNPALWSVEKPRLYRASTTIACNGRACDIYETPFGIRTFVFDSERGFILNGKETKIKGVCNHHDLGCLGAAVNRRALERQLQILKEMGVNGIRTSHNPPAPELLELCDHMGFIVLDEAFDMWKKKKTNYDYSRDWDEWHTQDMEDMVLRDRNHPCVILWSIGNEVMEQWDKNDSTGMVIARDLAATIRRLDPTRPITAACNDQDPLNPLIRSGVLDVIGYNYALKTFPDFPKVYPGKKFLATETTSALATRGSYDMPSETIRRWPTRWDQPFHEGNRDNTCSSYDNCSTPWGSTHEETWKIVKQYPFLSGMYIWTGFDYLGEPTPYDWPSRSSYFGIIDLAGFPKDAYYMYQSEWADKPVLHVFPHWNWKNGDTVDVWAYTNCATVELFLNGTSLGTREKTGDELHLMWRVPYVPGTLRAVGHTGSQKMLTQEVKTAGTAAKILLEPDRKAITADGTDLSFITATIVDDQGTLVPRADNLINFTVTGGARIAGVDNGLQTSDEPFQAHYRKAFNGMCLAVIQSGEKAGQITVAASAAGLKGASVVITSR